MLAAQPATVRAQDFGTSLDRLAADSFPETQAAIDEIARSGSPAAVALLEAMADRRLLIDGPSKSVIVKDTAGKLIDARTGKPISTLPSGATPVRINNRLRGALDSVLGTLILVSPDRDKRINAAEAVFKSRKASDLVALDKALSSEKDAGVKAVMQKARAAILLAAVDKPLPERMEAVASLSGWSDAETLSLLNQTLAAAKEPELKTATEAAITRIEHRRQLLAGVQNVLYGLSLGSVLLLAAIGLAITFGVMGVINMAHGEMVMLGAYTTFVVQEAFRAWAPGAFDFSLLVAIPLAFIFTGLVGIAIERGIIRFLYGRPLETLLATWGVSLALQQAVRTVFGPTNREVGNPSFMSGGFDFYGVSITWGRLWIIVFTLLVFAALQLVLRATRLGLEMRAVTQNRRMASSMGIRSARVDALTFGLGSGIAGIAGVALSQIDNVSPNLGQSYIVDSFMVVVFGGVGNLWGTFVSAFALGIANKLLEPMVGAVLGKILILVLLILFIQKRPRGLFALKGRAIEA
ncbi:MAG: urea ABC transporter permease subunit UrtB [Proteobacteria bacterium]|nr:urea ABC transporter permease subunit UrtB [Pseudomonadota bacterium]